MEQNLMLRRLETSVVIVLWDNLSGKGILAIDQWWNIAAFLRMNGLPLLLLEYNNVG